MTEHTSRLSTALADRYVIDSRVGEGGMATVYLAQDLKHDRKVALKVLRPELAAVLGADRFVQEIKTTAALQHPHILPLFDSGEADGFLYYVMPYIEGETLRGLLNRETQLDIDEAVRIASDVADALDYAHRNGVIHRDIKPENILMHDGRPMVADFGIALAVSAAAGGRMTETGLSLGTPHYMSPEQATAEKEISGRSDIYSLGSVLYEMLTGEPPHTGATAQAIVMKIVADDARPVTDLRKTVPHNVAAAVAKSIAKLPADRFASARAFAEALADAGFTLPTMAGDAALPGGGGRTRSSALTVSLAGLLAVMTVLALIPFLTPDAEPPVVRQRILLWDNLPGDSRFLRFQAALAPDGSAIVYRARVGDAWQLVVKRRGELAAAPLAGTESANGPFYSPDGAWIGFGANAELRKVPSGGGAALTIADSMVVGAGGAWLADNTVLFNTPAGGLRRVDAAGGSATAIVESFGTYGQFFGWPIALPDGRGALLTACRTPECSPGAIHVYDARADTVRQLLPEGQGAWYAEGHLLYGRPDGGLFAAPFNLATLEIEGPSVPVLDEFQPPNLLLTDHGTALYVLGDQGAAGLFELVWLDRSGRATRVQDGWTFDPGNADWGVSLSPDGRRIAVRENTDLGQDIWVKQLPSGPRSRFTLNDTEDRMPRWSPDGRVLTFISVSEGEGAGRLDLYQAPADGTGEPELLFDYEASLSQGFYTPDGEWLVLRTAGPRGSRGAREILGVRVGTDSVVSLVSTDDDEQAPAVSPDGRWLAYLSDETGRNEVFIRPFPETGRGKWQVSDGGANAPVWGHTGPHLFFVNEDRTMMQATIEPGPPFSVISVEPLFELPTGVSVAVVQGYLDVTRDDQRFLVRREAQAGDEQRDTRQLVWVQNWFSELRERLEGR